MFDRLACTCSESAAAVRRALAPKGVERRESEGVVERAHRLRVGEHEVAD